MAVPVKHSGEPRSSIAVPFDQRPRSLATAVAVLLVGGAILLPLVYVIYAAVFTSGEALALAAGTVLLMALLGWLGGRLAYTA